MLCLLCSSVENVSLDQSERTCLVGIPGFNSGKLEPMENYQVKTQENDPGDSVWQRRRRIGKIGVPIMLGMSIYVILEIVDMLFVGRIGTTALASVGISVFISYMFMAIFGGVSVGVQATTSRLVGQGEKEDLGRYLRTALLLAFLIVPPFSILLMIYSPEILGLMSDDTELVSIGSGYLAWLFGTTFLFIINSAFMGYWNATERTGLYLRVNVLTAVVNIPLNYIFIFGLGPVPAYGVTGAGIGTCLAAFVGAGYHLILGFRYIDGLWAGSVKKYVRVFVSLAMPVGMQQFTDALALTLMFRIVAFIGTVEVAVYSVLVNLVSAVALPAWGLGLAGATLVGQAMGAMNQEEANRWAWDVVKLGTVMMVLIGTPLWLFPEFFLGFFIKDAETLAVAVLPCRVLGIMVGINGLGYLFSSLLNGAGDVKRVMYVSLATQYLVLLPFAYYFGVYAGFGLIGIWLTHQIGFRALNSLILTILWQQRRWAKIKLWP